MSKFDTQFAGRLDGQTVLVTDAKGGIGHETAQGIGNSGATVLVHARRADDAQRAVDHDAQDRVYEQTERELHIHN